jgi:conjugal transfer pilus assembly protein TraV
MRKALSMPRRDGRLLLLPALMTLASCAGLGSILSPYSETFSCKNADHGQCLHPDKAYADAVAGRASRADPQVTRDPTLPGGDAAAVSPTSPSVSSTRRRRGIAAATGAYAGYRDSLYRELQGLLDQPVTPMLKPPRTVRTLILPYAGSKRPDRLYMPRYVYSIIEAPAWVVGDYLAAPVQPSPQAPVLGQVQDRPFDRPAPAAVPEAQP